MRSGIVGTGLMGGAMARRLLGRGWRVTAWNREAEALPLLVARGALAATSPAAVAAAAPVALLCVIDTAAVEACVFGADGLAAGLGPGCMLVDLSTTDPVATRDMAVRLRRDTGAGWVDAPVSGGPAAAEAGTLAIMAGGDETDLEAAEPVLAELGQTTRMGPVGAGQTAKLVNQALVGTGFVLMAEALAMAEATGVDAARLPACLAGGLADSRVLAEVFPAMQRRAFEPRMGYASQLGKDMHAVAALAEVGAGAAEVPGTRRSLRLAEGAILRLVEPVAAALVVLEVVVLGAGVVSRYLLDRPLVWSDELASALFLWLATLGAVIALGRGEHMRLGAVVDMLPARLRPWLDAFGLAVTLACVAVLVQPAVEHVEQQWVVTTPGLHIRDGLRVSAILVGVVLMSALAVLQLLGRVRPVHAAGAMAAVLLLCAALWRWQDALTDMGNANLLLFFVGLVALCVAAGTPIAFSFGAASLAYLATATDMPLSIMVDRIDEGTSELILLAVPLFILLGYLIELMGLAQALIEFMVAVLGHVRGGMSYALLGGMYLVSGISGSKAADMAAIVPSLFPGMKQRGAEPGELVAQLAASGAMSETIPPSLVLITIGSSAGVSIAGLFTGGLLPAVGGMLALVLVVRLRAGRDRPGVRPPAAVIGRSLVVAAPALALPFLIRAAVVKGVATATEVSTVGIAYTIVAGLLLYRRGSWARVYPMLTATAALAGSILLIIGMATAMAWCLTQSGFSATLVDAMKAVPGGRAGFLAVSVAVFAVLGSVLEGIPAIVLLGPLLFPAARALGVHDVHYAMTVVLAMGLGLFAPPFGVGFYFSCAIGGAAPDEAWTRVWPYLGALLLAVIVVAAFPWLSVGFL